MNYLVKCATKIPPSAHWLSAQVPAKLQNLDCKQNMGFEGAKGNI
jgi:hypothetical protein